MEDLIVEDERKNGGYLKQGHVEARLIADLAITARNQVEDRVSGLELGPDDCQITPFALSELRARAQAYSHRARDMGYIFEIPGSA